VAFQGWVAIDAADRAVNAPFRADVNTFKNRSPSLGRYLAGP
jgi:hypothetical protein